MEGHRNEAFRTKAAESLAAEQKRLNTDLNETIDNMVQNKIKEIEAALEQQIQEAQAHTAQKIAHAFRRKSPDSTDKATVIESDTEIIGKILWVDDHPENNAYEVAVLKSAGETIESVTTTKAAMHKIAKPDWKLVISDMARGDDNRAGLDLLKKIQEGESPPPVIFYASKRARRIFGPEAKASGAEFTTTPDELFAAIARPQTRIG